MKDMELATELRDVIAKARNYSDVTDAHEIFMDAETIIGTLAFLISPIACLEQTYKMMIVEFMEDGDSNAKAKSKAEASDSYRDWKKLKAIYELGEQQLMLLKKFKDDLNSEYARS